MNLPLSSDLPDTVARVAASVLGLSTRRHAGAAVLWRDGVAVCSASVAWRSPKVSLVLPDGEQLEGELRGADGSTDLAAISFASGALPPAAREPQPAERVGDFVFAVGREASGLVQASFGHVGCVAGAWRSWRGGRVDRLIRLDGGLYPGLEGAAVANAARSSASLRPTTASSSSCGSTTERVVRQAPCPVLAVPVTG